MKKYLFLATFAIFMFSGCAEKVPQLSRDEWIKTTTRIYDKTPDEILNASEKLFKLADGDDFKFQHTETSLMASRSWSIYLVLAASMGTDSWQVQTSKMPDGKTKVSIQATTIAGAILPMATTNSQTYSVGTTPTLGGEPIPGTALYDLFFSRLEYLMGLKKEWMTCDMADKKLDEHITTGYIANLCNAFNVKDDLPEELRMVQK